MAQRWQRSVVRRTAFLPRALNSWTFLMIAAVLFGLLGIALAKELWRSYQVKTDLSTLEAEIQQLEQKNSELGNFVTYLGSDAYQETAAKERLGLQQPGERVVALPDVAVNGSAGSSNGTLGSVVPFAPDTRGNPRKWWDYYFAPTALTLQ